ncbi:hypothetical protein LTR36_002395 [Oleoguttula mirabilis]|uniref:glucan endo-1,3-beta-D-glucosidase n=1 Tax=Oleoguttula mirabilis TaxID=1507867 RepID=A0AAV9JKH8_9PEZI|nr:hypothetical protein LTR36_002395 [Oleoguttula mirabilis]
MEKHLLRFRASHLLPLIAVLQIPISSAHPFAPEYVPPPSEHTLSDVEYTSWPSKTYTSTSDAWQPTNLVWEIADGQIQAPYTTAAIPTSGSDTFVSTSTVTNEPRWWPMAAPPWDSAFRSHHLRSTPVSTATSSTPALSSSSDTTADTAPTSLTSSATAPSSATATTSSSAGISAAETTPLSSAASAQGAVGVATSTTTEIISSTNTFTTTTSIPDISLTSLTTSAVQTATAEVTHNTTGSVHTSLETAGNPSVVPFPTSLVNATSTLSLVSTATPSGDGPTATAKVTSIEATNIFQAIATDAPPTQIPRREDHPVAGLGVQEQGDQLETNKFYANFFLGDQSAGTWTHPYSVAWSKGVGESGSWGLAISHIERSQLATDDASPSKDAGQWGFFADPVGIQSMVLSAAEFDGTTSLTTDRLEAFSVNVNLAESANASALLTFPLCQGMAFITGVYNSGTPLVQSGIGISSLTYAGAVINDTTYKYRVELQNGLTWLVYVTPRNSGYSENSFTLLSTGTIQGPSGFGGYIQIAAINSAAYAELMQNISQQTNVGSLYYNGKALAKFAAICYTVNNIAGNASLAQTGLALLQDEFAVHVNNQMTIPLVYDTVWGGAVSNGTYATGDIGDDFGNTLYNDHHFHYGYFVYAAAVIGYLDPSWLNESNVAWVNMLVRDYANSITDDPYFPFQRMFDWYHGHSWAHGLIETADGKDQESSSEDTMASYGMKMWGQIIGDTNMEARGNLILAVQERSLQHYYLYTNDNMVEPAEFIGNKAAGIVFENKIDHTTYFGGLPEYIEGIHMLPLMPFSTLTRSTTFVQQEWDAYFGFNGIKPVDQVSGGWKGILMANLAIVDPTTSYKYFSNSTGNLSLADLDGGTSQTWCLAWSAALGGSSATSKEKRRGDSVVGELVEFEPAFRATVLYGEDYVTGNLNEPITRPDLTGTVYPDDGSTPFHMHSGGIQVANVELAAIVATNTSENRKTPYGVVYSGRCPILSLYNLGILLMPR